MTTIHIVQVPFSATWNPHPMVRDYYRDYSRVFSGLIDGYFIPEESLWEIPLWTAHLFGMVRHIGAKPVLQDLSQYPANARICGTELLSRTQPGDSVLFSPLAQNFDLTLSISAILMNAGRRTVIGGNMSPLLKEGDATVIHLGQAVPESLREALTQERTTVSHFLQYRDVVNWQPDYEPLIHYKAKVPLLRLNASHGCLFKCDFCGDAWSRKLAVVPEPLLEKEVVQFETYFPDTRLIYIGDKIFGQSPEAVANLLRVFANRPKYRFIIQTHFLAVTDDLLDRMEQLGVMVVELGFESASLDLLRQNHKTFRSLDAVLECIDRIHRRGIKVVLNILNGLPTEDRQAHEQTLDFIRRPDSHAWLYNLYNFVPYPMTPYFSHLKYRIVDWDFANWREDFLPVFEPFVCSREEIFEFFLEKVEAAHNRICMSLSDDGRLAFEKALDTDASEPQRESMSS